MISFFAYCFRSRFLGKKWCPCHERKKINKMSTASTNNTQIHTHIKQKRFGSLLSITHVFFLLHCALHRIGRSTPPVAKRHGIATLMLANR